MASGEYSFHPKFSETNGEYTFYPRFSEFVTLYRGVIRIWIADGTSVNPGTAGKLYAEYIDGLVQELGYVSDYEQAKEYFHEIGISLTYVEWIKLLSETPQNASRSEAWATGKQKGEPVSESDETHNNNAMYYAEKSKIYSDGENFSGEAVSPDDNAKHWNDESHGWANNGESGQYSETNNAKYWAEQSKEFTNGKDLSDTVVRATDNAEYFKDQSKLWANNGEQGTLPTATNNARYWAEQSKEYTNGKDLSDQSVAERSSDNAAFYKDQAKLWANNGTDGDVPSASNNAKAYAANSEENNKQAESWAKGTRGGIEDTIRPNASTDNASYYSNQANLWANNGESDTPSATNNAKAYSEQSNEFERQAESWAQGTRDGVADTERQDASVKNSKSYCETSKLWANNGTDGDVPSATNNAKAYSEASNEFELQAESWAKGTRDGVTDTERENASTDNAKKYSEVSRDWANFNTDGETPSSTNNAKSYAMLSKNWANFGTDGDNPSSTNNAKAYSDESHEYERQAESWAKGTRDGSADISRTNASKDNSYYYSEESKKWANFGTDGSEPSSTNNAKAYAGNASDFAQSAEESKLQSESWAKGTRDGATDRVRQDAAINNSQYYSNQARLWANNGTDGTVPSASNNAKEYARQASVFASNASTSETNASNFASNANTSAINAANSATSAEQSALSASSSKTNAENYATNAAQSAQNSANSATNAAQSAQDANQYKNDSQAAKTAAETAQNKTEEAITKYPRITNDDYWQVWNPAEEEWEKTAHKSIAYATTEYGYQNSSSGTVVPTGTWSLNPNPQNGFYLWVRIRYIWTNGRTDDFYNVSYIGVNGTGSVDSVNGLGGDVILDGKNIYIDHELEVKETIYDALSRIGTSITNEQIDALFNVG